MATVTWVGNALDRKQINTITIAGTWSAGDTATMTINGKDVIVTVGASGTATTEVATSIKEAWESVTRLDGTGTWPATSNAGAQEFGEFAEVTAAVSGSVVTLVANKAGKPFTLTVADSAGSGSATGAVVTTATGKNYWSDADNWDTGSVPANNDTVVFRDSNVSCLYGLPNASLEVTLQVWMSFTGEIGLPRINNENGNADKQYYEYRQRYVRLDDAGAGTSIAHRFGLGKDGTGPTLINLKHSTLECAVVVYNTGPPNVSRIGTKALNICCTANTSTLNILGGSVDYSSQDGATSAFVTVTQAAGDSRGINAMKASGSIFMSGGTAVAGGTTALAEIRVRNGQMRVEQQSGDITSLKVHDGVLDYASVATITAIQCDGGTFDARSDSGAFSVGSVALYKPAKYLDPYRRTTPSGNFVVYDDLSPDWLFGIVPGDGVSLVLH